jgi:hypothetical protein
MSPLGYFRWLSGRCSRERHCNRGVIFTFPWFGHISSAFLSPLAPPICGTRLLCYYGDSDFCRPASSGECRCRLCLLPSSLDKLPVGLGPSFGATRAPLVTTALPRLIVRQRSLLLSLDLPTIPSPTTVLPFRYDRFRTLLHRRSLPRLSPGLTHRVGGIAVARSRVRHLPGGSPTGLAETSSLYYGLVVRLRLLSTLPLGNAVTTFDFRPVTLAW